MILNKGKVEFEWFSEDIDADALERAIGASIFVYRGARAKSSDKEGIVYIKNLNVEGDAE